ncbi:hypothetical protein BGZ95_002098 [Linnemannia exigua]|uniref:Uncharacterized protein n=1 Tax=Linnemannia exigua TaxID=604196 RepID=A0AAD4D605_9FUNG|nr:hypothetical protein BGZ95_002098 [Linnemannia exigua]
MRSSILLLVAASLLVAVQAAPISTEAQPAAATPDFVRRCGRDTDGTWVCYGENSVDPKAASIDFRTGDCVKIKNELVCPGKGLVGDAEPKAASIEPEAYYPGQCWKVDDHYECIGVGLVGDAEPKAASAEPEGIAPAPSRCWKVNGEWRCSGGIDPHSGGSSPSRLPCRTIGGKDYCDGIKK